MGEGFFSGLVQGVGETKLSLEKEKRERQDKDKSQQLQVLTGLLATPGLKPEQRSDLFRMALEVASGGDKKVVEGMHGILGPILTQGQDSGQTGGVRPGQAGQEQPPPQGGSAPQPAPAPVQGGTPASGSAGLPKLGSSGSGGTSRNVFYTPEEENQQLAQRAGMVAKATGEVDVELYQKKLAMELEAKKQEGFKLTGFTEPDPKTGLVTPVYTNELTQQFKYGGPVDPFTSLEAGLAIEVNKAQLALARKQGVDSILRGQGIQPESATPEQKQRAEQAYANIILQEQQVDIQAKKAGAFRDIASGTAALDRSLEREQLDMNKQLLEYNRQRDDYDRQGQQIQELVKQVESSKAEASEAFNQAMVIKNYLESQGLDPNGFENPEDEHGLEQGYTPANYQLLLGKAKAALAKARSIASSASTHFKGSVEAGNLDEQPGKWPYIKDVRPGFSATPSSSLPPMPSQNVGGAPGAGNSVLPKNQRKSQQIDVPKSLLDELYKP
jgi:hypothetical protein